jgi:hypothetical protein
MRDPENVVELEYVTTSETDSLIPMRFEEETSIVTQGEVGQSSRTEMVLQTLILKHQLNSRK